MLILASRFYDAILIPIPNVIQNGWVNILKIIPFILDTYSG